MKEQEKLKAIVLKLYSTGSKVADIVTQTGAPRSTVYYWIKNEIPKETPPLNLRDYHFLKQKCERQEKIIAILKSAPCAATAPLQERLAAIEQMVSEEYNVNTLCEALEVAKGTYYNHTLRNKRGETKMLNADASYSLLSNRYITRAIRHTALVESPSLCVSVVFR